MANDDMFETVPPNMTQMAKLNAVRDAAKIFGDVLRETIPPGPDKTYVFRTFRTAMMWASVAIMKQPDGSARQSAPVNVKES